MNRRSFFSLALVPVAAPAVATEPLPDLARRLAREHALAQAAPSVGGCSLPFEWHDLRRQPYDKYSYDEQWEFCSRVREANAPQVRAFAKKHNQQLCEVHVTQGHNDQDPIGERPYYWVRTSMFAVRDVG